MKRPTKTELRKAIDDEGGQVEAIAERFGVRRRTVYNWLGHYSLNARLALARRPIQQIADDNIYDALLSDDPTRRDRMTQFVKLNLNDSGAVRWSDKALALMDMLNIEPSAAVTEFEALLEAHAATVAKAGR